MHKTVVAVLLAVSFSGCASLSGVTESTVSPNLKISREIPTDIAIGWLKKVATAHYEIPACRYNDQGIVSRDGNSTISWNKLRSSPWSAGFTHTIGAYEVYATNTRDSATGWVTVSRMEVRVGGNLLSSNHGDECSAFHLSNKTINEAQIAEVQKSVERTLSALAALGVVIEQQPPKGTQP